MKGCSRKVLLQAKQKEEEERKEKEVKASAEKLEKKREEDSEVSQSLTTEQSVHSFDSNYPASASTAEAKTERMGSEPFLTTWKTMAIVSVAIVFIYILIRFWACSRDFAFTKIQ